MPNNFTYNLNIPNPPNNPQVDVPNMKVNTNSISSIIGVDHVGFNTNGSGIHKQVTLLNEAAPGLGDGNGVLYANLANGQSWPFWQNALGSFQLFGQNSIAASGFVTIPGGLIIQWGGGSVNASGSTTTFTFPLTFPNNLFAITIGCRTAEGNSPGANNQFIKEGSQSTTSFQIVNSSSSGSRKIYYIAIGN